MGAACLDLLRERVHVAEAALERAARKDRVDARSFVGEVCHLGRRLDRVGAGEPHAGPVGDLDRRHTGIRVDRGERLDQIGARRPSRASARATSACTTALSARRARPRGALRDASAMNSESIARAMPNPTAATPTA